MHLPADGAIRKIKPEPGSWISLVQLDAPGQTESADVQTATSY